LSSYLLSILLDVVLIMMTTMMMMMMMMMMETHQLEQERPVELGEGEMIEA
jgi:hypothetical protein